MSLITWNGLKPPPSENVSNSYSGVRYLFREIWNHLPVWLGVFNLLSMAFMAMAFFTPSRTVYVLAAGFPRFSTDAVRTKTAGIRTLKIILACLALLLVIAGFVRPMVGNNVVTPIADFYPGAQVQLDAAHSIVGSDGNPILDATGIALQQSRPMIAPDGRQYKVEGKLLIDVPKKRALATY